MIFEGPPGAGKSTLSEFAAEQLQLNGVSVDWFAEGTLERDHFKRFSDHPHNDVTGAARVLLDDWARVMEQFQASNRHVILDGAYFGNTLKYLLGRGMAVDEIQRLGGRIEGLLAPLDPVIVHLTGDTAAIFGRAIRERGDNWARYIASAVNAYPYQRAKGRTGIAGMTAFFVDSYEVLAELLRSSTLKRVAIDTEHGDWPTVEERLLALIDVARRARPRVHIEPARYVGTYRPPSGFPQPYDTPFAVEAVGDELRLHVVFIGNQRLIPSSATHFRMAAKNLAVEFVLDEHGEATDVVYPWTLQRRHLCKRISRDPVRPVLPENYGDTLAGGE